MSTSDANFTITATDKTKQTFDAVEKRFGSLSNKAAESTSKLAGVASWAGYASGLEGAGKAAQAFSGSLGILSGSMSLLGGPAGLVLAAAAGIFAFVTASDKSAESISKLDDKIAGANSNIAKLAGNLVEVQRIELADQIRKITEEMNNLKEETKGGPSLFGSDAEYWKQQDLITTRRREINALTTELGKYDAMAKKGITDPNAEKNAAKEAERLAKEQAARDKAAATALANQKQQAAAAFDAMQMSYAEKENAAAAHYAKNMDIILTNEKLGVMSEERAGVARNEALARYVAERETLEKKDTDAQLREADKRKQIRDKFDQLGAGSYDPAQKAAADFAREWEVIQTNQNMRTASEEEANAQRLSAQERYNQRVLEIDNAAGAANKKLWESGWEGKRQVMSGVLGSMSTLMQSKNKTMFEVGKKAAISQAVIDTYASAVGAYKSLASIPYVGPALGVAAAAAAVASGMAQVSAIKSTSFGGGSTGVSVGSGGVAVGTSFNGGAGTAPQLPAQQQQTQQQVTTIQFVGDVYGLDDFKEKVVLAIRDATSRDVSFA